MSQIWRVFCKDLFETLCSLRTMLLVFAFPVLLVVLAGRLQTEPPEFRLLVAGVPEEQGNSLLILEDLASFEVEVQEAPAIDPLAAIRKGRFDILMNAEGPGEPWVTYTAETEPLRYNSIRAVAFHLERLMGEMGLFPGAPRPTTPVPQPPGVPPPCGPGQTVTGVVTDPAGAALPGASITARGDGGCQATATTDENGTYQLALPQDSYELAAEFSGFATAQQVLSIVSGEPSADVNFQLWLGLAAEDEPVFEGIVGQGRDDLIALISALQPVRSLSLSPYYSRAGDPSNSLMPQIIALVVCFLPFILAAPTLLREKQAHTLEALWTVPGMTGPRLMAGKLLYPIVATLFVFLTLLISVQAAYHIHIKPGFLAVTVLVVPATVASASLGVVVSSLATTNSQATASSGCYFLCLGLLSGFIYPIDSESGLVSFLSNLFPLTFVHPVLRPWMFGVWPIPGFLAKLAALVAQGTLYGLLSFMAFRRYSSRL